MTVTASSPTNQSRYLLRICPVSPGVVSWRQESHRTTRAGMIMAMHCVARSRRGDTADACDIADPLVVKLFKIPHDFRMLRGNVGEFVDRVA